MPVVAETLDSRKANKMEALSFKSPQKNNAKERNGGREGEKREKGKRVEIFSWGFCLEAQIW